MQAILSPAYLRPHMNYANSITRLRHIMDELRLRCPWDQKQTIQTLRQLTIEETYELADAITRNNWQDLKEELGDLLLHLVFYSKIASEQQHFTFDDVIETLCNKLVERHPHIYDSTVANTAEEVAVNWEKIKLKSGKTSILSGVPPGLPALVKALRLQEKTKKVGFEWTHIDQVKEKLNEELDELSHAIEGGRAAEIEDEMGDVLFSMINYARFAGVDPEGALEKTNQKFIRRFQAIEKLAAEKGTSVHDLDLQEMDALWNQVKLAEHKTAREAKNL